ncbi:MAG: hypothetical protein Kow0037_00710 [Calditrichia bacterium]
MTIDERLQMLINRIKAYFPAHQVEGFPEEPSGYRLMHANGALLVRYDGGDYDEPESFTTLTQGGLQYYTISVVMRNLREKEKQSGLYRVLDNLRACINGFSPQKGEKFYCIKEQFVEEENGIWVFESMFAVRTMGTY